MSETVCTCGAVIASCVCIVEGDQAHESPHVCECGGSWEDRFGEFDIIAWPGFNPAFPAVAP